MSTTETRDRFLDYHLPGVSRSVERLRRGIAIANSSFNHDLLRTVLIVGESGVGKNHVARVLAGHHYWSRTAQNLNLAPDDPLSAYTARFAEVGLPTLPDTMVESELFGHTRGAFTDARREKKGLLAGPFDDILLDEIGDASTVVQGKLLGVIETRQFRKLGADPENVEDTSARLLLATHRDLVSRTRAGEFREDLFWRITEFVVEVPPLREQIENLPAIAEYQRRTLLGRGLYSTEGDEGLRKAPNLTADDLAWAAIYQWPGNIRELRHALVRWLAFEGKVAFKEVVQRDALSRALSTRSVHAETPAIRHLVWSRLDAAKAQGVAVADKLGLLVAALRHEIEREIVAWYDERRPNSAELESLFPGSKRDSIASKFSTWRKR